ncbi:MAG: cold-shock protein [Desulfobaccales bacterium]
MANNNGTVKWFNEAKGYGFIKREDGPDLFVHYTNIAGSGFRTLKEEDPVEFEISEGPKGLQAINVCKIVAAIATAPAAIEEE